MERRKEDNMKIAIITAGGVGSRMKLEVPKQFHEINGKPIIVYSLEVFNNCSEIDYICVVFLEGYKQQFENYITKYRLNKIKWLVPGGATNQMSIWNAIDYLKKNGGVHDDDIILVHDGIRPLVSNEIIKDCIQVCEKNGNAVAITPCNEAMVISKTGTSSTESIDRSLIWKTQTPHAMHLKDMHELISSTINRGVTNSVAVCTMLIESGKPIYFSKGNNLNFKLTTPEDIDLFIGILKAQGRF